MSVTPGIEFKRGDWITWAGLTGQALEDSAGKANFLTDIPNGTSPTSYLNMGDTTRFITTPGSGVILRKATLKEIDAEKAHRAGKGTTTMPIPLGPQSEVVQLAFRARENEIIGGVIAQANHNIIEYAKRGTLSPVRVPLPLGVTTWTKKELSKTFMDEAGWTEVKFGIDPGDGPHPSYDYMELIYVSQL